MDLNSIRDRIETVYYNLNALYSQDINKDIRWASDSHNITFGSNNELKDFTKVYNLIASIADIKDILKKKMRPLGKDPIVVENYINTNLHLQTVVELGNLKRHGLSSSETKRSNKAPDDRPEIKPEIKNVKSSVDFKFGQNLNGGVVIDFINQKVSTAGDTQGSTQIEADIFNGSGEFICTLDILVNEAMTLWDKFILEHNIK